MLKFQILPLRSVFLFFKKTSKIRYPLYIYCSSFYCKIRFYYVVDMVFLNPFFKRFSKPYTCCPSKGEISKYISFINGYLFFRCLENVLEEERYENKTEKVEVLQQTIYSRKETAQQTFVGLQDVFKTSSRRLQNMS